MLTSGGFETWNGVTWKLLNNGRCYFKGTAYFKNINKTDFFIGSIKSNLKIIFHLEQQAKPILELKYSADDTNSENQQMGLLPPALLETLRINLIITLPGDIEDVENFERIDSQTAMFVLRGSDLPKAAEDCLSDYFKDKGTIKLILASAGRDLFNYQSQVRLAQNEFEGILKNIRAAGGTDDRFDKDRQISKDGNVADSYKPPVEESKLKNDFNARLRQGFISQVQGDFNKALEIYKNITDDANADEKYKAAAGYQTGVCLLKMGGKKKAKTQFEYVINTYPSQRTAALKSVKMLQDIRSGKTDTRGQKQAPFVINTSPELYSEDVDPNIRAVTIVFSEPMKKTDWFYSSFSPALLPRSTGLPFFDQSGSKWTLPVKLEPGKVYAIAVNYYDAEKDIKNPQAGFRSAAEQRCDKFVLVFATANEEQLPTPIKDKIIEKSEKINFKP
jgi:tetratricopeptide (TPR) repeat protein